MLPSQHPFQTLCDAKVRLRCGVRVLAIVCDAAAVAARVEEQSAHQIQTSVSTRVQHNRVSHTRAP
jgi:hypothetical protein